MTFVQDWKEAYTWYSMHAAAILGLLSAAQALLPQMQALIPSTAFPAITGGLSLLIMLGRLLAQESPQ